MGIGYIVISVIGLAFLAIRILDHLAKRSQLEDPAAKRRRLAHEDMVEHCGREAADRHLQKLKNRYPDWPD